MEKNYELDLDEMGIVAGGAGSGGGSVETDGTVLSISDNGVYHVDVGGKTVTAVMSGKLRMNYIRIMPGDRVRVDCPPKSLHARITSRCKD